MVIFVLKIIHVLSNSIKDTERCLTFAGIFPDKVISRLPFSQMTRYSVVCVRVCVVSCSDLFLYNTFSVLFRNLLQGNDGC